MVKPDFSRLHENVQLASKKKALLFVSLLLIGIEFTGLKITEVNTFFVKMELGRQTGLVEFLLLIEMYLIVRYYNYAKPYQDQIYGMWTKNLLSHNHFTNVCPYSDDATGLTVSMAPEFYIRHLELCRQNSHASCSVSYVLSFPFSRRLQFCTSYEHEQKLDVSIFLSKGGGFRAWCVALFLEARYQVDSWINSSHFLDVYGPYFVAVFSVVITSYSLFSWG